MEKSENLDFGIYDKYISQHALPREPVNAWIKWKEVIEFDELIFRFPKGKDGFIHRLWNVHEDATKNQDGSEGHVIIDKKYLEIDGWFGFQYFFISFPESDKKINFRVEFVKNHQTIYYEEFVTTIIVPNIRIRSDSELDLIITEDSSEEIKLNLVVEKLGSAVAQDLKMLIGRDRVSKGLQVNIKSEGPEEPAYTTATISSRITLTGSGEAVLRISFEYKDLLGNSYRSNTLVLALRKNIASPRYIPIESRVEGNNPMIVAHNRF